MHKGRNVLTHWNVSGSMLIKVITPKPRTPGIGFPLVLFTNMMVQQVKVAPSLQFLEVKGQDYHNCLTCLMLCLLNYCRDLSWYAAHVIEDSMRSVLKQRLNEVPTLPGFALSVFSAVAARRAFLPLPRQLWSLLQNLVTEGSLLLEPPKMKYWILLKCK